MSVPIYAYALPTLAAAGYDVRKITSILRCQIAGCTRTATRIAGCGKGQRETENGWLLCASCASHCFYKLGKIARLREAEFYEKRVRNIDMTEIPGPPIVNGDEAAKRDELASAMDRVLDTLCFREREVIKLRYGIGRDGSTYSLAKVGKLFRISADRVRQIEVKALRKLKHPVRARMLTEF
jgi:RNA polymerase sigma factor (sigma-70 family)